MIEYRYRLLELLSKTGEIKGRKKLQKMFYIIQSLGYNLDLDYTYHNYGPYSSQLQAEVDFLFEEELISENRISNMYVYQVREKGEQLLTKLEQSGLTGISPDVPAAIIQKLQDSEAQFLELVATIMYLRDLGFDDDKEIQAKVVELKPHLERYYSNAVIFIEQLQNFQTAGLV